MPRRRGRPGARALAGAAAAAVVLHMALLGTNEQRPPPAPQPARPVPLDVRTVPAPLQEPLAAVAEAAAPAATVRAPAPRQSAPVPRSEAVAPAAPLVAAASQRERPQPDPADVEVAPPAAVVPTAAGPAAVSAVSEAPEAIPVYRTAPAAAATLQYELKRGFLSGTGALQWKPADGRYEVRLEGNVAGLHVLTETSTGTLDRHGLAPLRYTDWRARRSTTAANFQRDAGKITYSGPQVENPLPPGSQDRVSWMVQIGAVLNAEPQHAAPGGRIVFYVSGAQGDADVWAFRYAGTEMVTTRLGPVHAVRFTREPRKTYDRQVDVWLAPGRQHLPVRARFTTQANGEVFELLLRDIQSP